MLTRNELKQLRNEITLNSIFLKDYKNSFDIDIKKVYCFFDSYMEYLYSLADDDKYSGDAFDVMNKYDNDINLWTYYNIFIDNPLEK